MKYGLNDEELGLIKAIFARYPNIDKSILFGSRAKGTNKPYSDVDIALVGNSLTITDVLRLHNDIDDLLLPYEFDICLYKDLENIELKNHIDRRGITIYDKYSSARACLASNS